MSTTNKRVGFTFPAKKLSRGGFDGFPEYAIQRGFDIIYLDLDRCLEEQGPFDMIVQKLNETLMATDDASAQRIANVKRYLAAHPQVLVIDPLSSLDVLLSREAITARLEELAAGSNAFKVPRSTVVPNLASAAHLDIRFPVLCKRVEACSTQASHEMVWVANDEQWRQLLQQSGNETNGRLHLLPFEFGSGKTALQQFVSHDGVLFKVYVCGDVVRTVMRPSLANVTAEYPLRPVAFDSQKIPKSFDRPADPADPVSVAFLSASPETRARMSDLADEERVSTIVQLIRTHFQLRLFGVDIIREASSGDYYVVDLNYFPSFDGIPDFHRVFLDVIRKGFATRA
ncbi:hypothetical protein RI367_001459 [Sorochytrium milnesiophthora]